MGKLFGRRVTIGQEKGPDIELVVHGDEFYARYETPEGYPVLYDDARGLFCYALLRDGRFFSTGVPASAPPPPGALPGVTESAPVRQASAAAREAARRPPPDIPAEPDQSGPCNEPEKGPTP